MEWIPGTPLIEIYPNPSHDQFYIRMDGLSDTPVLIYIINTVGEVTLSEVIDHLSSPQILKMDLSQNPGGVYFLIIKTNDEMIFKKIILLR